MTKDDIIRMAREAWVYSGANEMVFAASLERFAALVASAERERIKQENAPEIERVNAHIKELGDAVKEALAQPEQEPVAWPKTPTDISDMIGSSYVWREHKISEVEPHESDKYCVTAHDLLEAFENWNKNTIQPQPWEKFCDSNCVWTDHHPDCKLAQRTWVGLTFDERLELAEDVDWPAGAYCEYAEKIEAKLRSKNYDT